jgi:hypothetical protein
MTRIGLLNEKPLHAALKAWYALPGDQFEVSLDGYVIDIVRDDLLLEIQTGNFTSIKAKLTKLLQGHRVRLVYPIAAEKWIIKQSPDDPGESVRRKSPRRGRIEDLFWESVRIPHLLTHDNLALEVVMIQEEEVRRYDAKRNWRRRGWGIVERRLVDIVDQRVFVQPADWLGLLPPGLDKPFTTKELVEATGISRPLAQKMVYCFRAMGVIAHIGKRGRFNLYEIGTGQNA